MPAGGGAVYLVCSLSFGRKGQADYNTLASLVIVALYIVFAVAIYTTGVVLTVSGAQS